MSDHTTINLLAIETEENTKLNHTAGKIISLAHNVLRNFRCAKAYKIYNAALGIYEILNCKEGKIACLLGLGDAKLLECVGQAECAMNLDAAYSASISKTDALERAAESYDSVLVLIGLVEATQSEVDDSIKSTEITKIKAAYYKSMGDYALAWGKCELALAHYTAARRFCDDVKYDPDPAIRKLGLANCQIGLGNVALRHGKNTIDAVDAIYSEALGNYADAESPYQTELGRAHGIKCLGDVRRFAFKEAKNKIQLQDDARTLYVEAIGVYTKIGAYYSLGMTYCALAGISPEHEYNEILDRAEEAWLTIDRQDLIEELAARR